ncbi:unnamed protein product [Rodentolepis nana]|uniref:DUF3330 domain-containing protein n=1 Tax=Rodentolepis nana TaxID=102285 RepID=A0A0R3TFM8_RODNA|nr:unnamed protein product [Rodentolepis nana]
MNLSKEVRLPCKMACLRTADCCLQACTSTAFQSVQQRCEERPAFFSVPQGVQTKTPDSV